MVFYASEVSIESIGSIKARLEGQDISGTNRNVMIADAEDIEPCYAGALQCADLSLEGGRSAADVIVDVTGGTRRLDEPV